MYKRYGLALVKLGGKYTNFDRRMRAIRHYLEAAVEARFGKVTEENAYIIDEVLSHELTARILLRRVALEQDRVPADVLQRMLNTADYAKVRRGEAVRRLLGERPQDAELGIAGLLYDPATPAPARGRSGGPPGRRGRAWRESGLDNSRPLAR